MNQVAAQLAAVLDGDSARRQQHGILVIQQVDPKVDDGEQVFCPTCKSPCVILLDEEGDTSIKSDF